MRFFEILLVALMSIQLMSIFLNLLNKKRKTALLLLSLLLMGFQLVQEGFRWQMMPAYLLLFLLIAINLLKPSSKKSSIKFRNFGLILLLILAVFLSTSLPVLSFSNSSGEHRVGVSNSLVVDMGREEMLTSDTTDYREINLRLFYPTNSEDNQVAYIPNFELVKEAYQRKLGWPMFMLDYLKYFNIEASENSEIKSSEKFPLVIYSHGLTNNYTESTGRLLTLASKGYVVAAINHPYSSDVAVLSNNKIARYIGVSQLGDPLEQIDSAKVILANQWIDDVKKVISDLKESEKSSSIDFNSIGLVGFSAGGTMATLGSYKIDNVKAAVNLDGTPRGIDDTEIPKCPVLAMFSEPQIFTDAQIKAWGIDREMIEAPIRLINERAERILKLAPKPSYIIQVPDTRHSNFTEQTLVSPFSSQLGIGGEIDSWECYELINEIVFNFLDRNLKNKDLEISNYENLVINSNADE